MKIIAVALIKHPREDKYLLVQSTNDFGPYNRYYYPPGGHIEEDESIEEGLIREIREELAVVIDPFRKIACTQGDSPGMLIHWYECEVICGCAQMDAVELADMGFFSKEDRLSMNLFPATRSFFETYIDGPPLSKERISS